MLRLPGHVLPALSKANIVPSKANKNDQPMTLTIVLRHDDEAGLNRYLHELYDPHSPNFHHYLTQPQIAAKFGPSADTYMAALEYLRANSFELLRGSANRLTLTVRGTRANVERAFDIRIKDYRIGRRYFYASDRDPALPANLAPKVQSVGGLSNLAHVTNTVSIKSGFGKLICNILLAPFYPPAGQKFCGYDPTKAWKACVDSVPAWASNNTPLDIAVDPALNYATVVPDGQPCPPPPKTTTLAKAAGFGVGPTDVHTMTRPATSSLGGMGQTIGLVEFDTFEQSDVANYFNLIGLPSANLANLKTVNVNGGAAPGSNQDEVLLDIDTVMTLAEQAKVTVYDAPFEGGSSFDDVFNQMIDDKVTVISNSWSYCEDESDQADVDSVDSVLSNAALAGISVFNGAGDTGSTCLDGAANTIGVPADSPHATAVGGTTETQSLGGLYGTEMWWDGTSETPPTGQGGFGISKFFTTPSYQTGLNSMAMRSIPDVVTNADPNTGVEICQASAGGCPNNLFYGGTSIATPIWAAYTALINQAVGTNVGMANTVLYPLAGTSAFHDAASMGSDFQHVGLGSPNLDQMILALSHQTAGPPDANGSIVTLAFQDDDLSPSISLGVPSDGATTAIVVVLLADTNGNTIPGKTVTLAASPSDNAMISPASAVTSANNGAAVFTVTDLVPETLTFTATDTTDSLKLSMTPGLSFVTPPAASASIVASLSTEPADGSTPDTITVTLKDSLGRPTPGKVIALDQGGASSVVSAPSPAVTDSNGEIQFSVTDLHTESVTYTGTDVTDGNLPVPGSAMVDFTSGGGGCASASYVTGTANPAPGYAVSAFATGFVVSSGDQGFSYNCFGAYGMAWDAAGNMYVTDWPTGKVYKFGTSGGVADAGHLFTTVKAPATGLAIDPAGNMFASEGSVSGPDGDIVPVNLSNGTVGTAIASGIPCLGNMAIDPAIPALYVNDFCSLGPVSPNIWQVTGIDGASPTTVVYAQTPDNIENLNLAVAPDGAVYDVYAAAAGAPIARVAPGGSPVTTLTAADSSPISLTGGLGMTVGGKQASGDAQFVIAPFNPQASATSGPDEAERTLDLTGASPAPGAALTTTDFSGLSNFAIGPDGCMYVAGGPTVSRVTNADGSCGFGPATQPPAISLSPAVVMPNPQVGSSVNLTAQFHYVSVADGTPVTLQVSGANNRLLQSNTTGGAASFSYTGAFQGIDTIIASATLNTGSIASNPAVYTWDPGTDVTFLTLNQSPLSSKVNQTVTLTSNLTDVSQKPAVALSGEQVNFNLGGSGCHGTTDAKGNANCEVTPSGAGVDTLSANFAGTAQLNASSDSRNFNVVAMPSPTPVPGKLKISPKALNFGSVDIGASPIKSVKVTNAGKVKKKKSALPILIEMESGVANPFTLTQECDDDDLRPKAKGVAPGSCEVSVKFAPTAAMKYSGTLMIDTNLEPTADISVKLEGSGKAPKK